MKRSRKEIKLLKLLIKIGVWVLPFVFLFTVMEYFSLFKAVKLYSYKDRFVKSEAVIDSVFYTEGSSKLGTPTNYQHFMCKIQNQYYRIESMYNVSMEDIFREKQKIQVLYSKNEETAFFSF